MNRIPVVGSLTSIAGPLALLLAITGVLSAQSAALPARPRVFLLDSGQLVETREALKRGEAALLPSWTALRADAEKALALERFSVVDKGVTPPSGDKHDYMSQAPYWWPDPATPGGLPYIRRDGERNPELNRIRDHAALDGLIAAVDTLSLAAYLGADARFTAKAGGLLRAWFVDPATRMNPHLEYAQFIPGINTGRGIGLIETRGLARLVDSIGLLEASPGWRPDDGRALRDWFARFLAWMQESPHGRDEAAAKNNHGTFYDVQIASFSLLLDRTARAREILETVKPKRIAVQIEPDGRQPLELERTNSWGYSTMNLDGLTLLATLGDRVGVDLWSFRTPDGRGLRAALDYLAPFAVDGRTWLDPQISAFRADALFPILRRAAAHYTDDALARVLAKVPKPAPADRAMLVRR
jgi:hypothetical protein